MRKYLPIFLTILISFLLIFLWFKDGAILGTAESGLPFYNLDRMYQISRWAWPEADLGNNTSMLAGTAPTYWFLSQFQKIGIPGFLIEAAVLFILLNVAGISIYLLTKQLFPEIPQKYAFLAVLFYIFNPFAMVNIWVRFLTNHIFSYALFPLALYLFIRGLRMKDYKYSLIIALVSGLFSFALTSIPTNLLIWGFFLYTIIFYAATSKTTRDLIFYIKFFSLTLVFYLLINFWWLGQFLFFFFSEHRGTTVSSFFSGDVNTTTLNMLSQQLGQLTFTTRFLHGTFFTEGQWWAQLFVYPPFVVLEFLITGMIFWCILFYRKNINVLFLGLLFLIGIFLTKGNNPPFGEIFDFIFKNVPSFQVFRNPFEKFGFILILTAAPLLSKGMSGLPFHGRLNKTFFLLVLILMTVLWGYPYWTGAVFSSYKRINENIKDYKVEVPSYYKEANQFFKNQRGLFRFVSLPIGGEGLVYDWEKPYVGVELSSTVFDTANISNNTTIPFYSEFVSSLSNYQLSRKVLDFLPLVNSKYIVLRSDIDFKENYMADPNIVRQNLDQWSDEGLLTNRANFGKLQIYEINPDWFWPKIYMTSNFLVGNKPNLFNFVNLLNLGFPKNQLAIVSADSLSSDSSKFQDWVIKSDKVYSPFKEGAPIENYSDEDLLVRLFHAKRLPGEVGYLLTRLKELFETPRILDFWERTTYESGLLGKRMVEIYRLKERNANEGLINRAKNDYKKSLDQFSSKLISTNTDLPNLLKEILFFQYLLFKRIDLERSKQIKEILVNLNILPQFELPSSDTDKYLVYHFDVPVGRNYNLISNKVISAKKWFIDGKNITDFVSNNSLVINLSKGDHEAAFLVSDSAIATTIVEEDSISLNSKNQYDKEIGLLEIPAAYKIDFDYRFSQGNEFSLSITQDINKQKNNFFIRRIVKNNDLHNWQHWQDQFKSSVGAVKASLKIQQSQTTVCTSFLRIHQTCNLKGVPYEVELKNFSIKRLEENELAFVSSSNLPKLNSPTSWEWFRVNPTLYKIRVKKETDKVEMLVFSELFNSDWKLYLESNGGAWRDINLIENWRDKSKQYEFNGAVSQFLSPFSSSPFDNNHYLVNSYANGWLLEKAGEYNLILEFAPQRILEFGKMISRAVTTFALIYFFGILIKNKLYKKNED